MTITVTTEIRQTNDDLNSITIATKQNETSILLSWYENPEALNNDSAYFRLSLTHEFIKEIAQVFTRPCA